MTNDPVNHPKHYTSHPAHCKCGAGIECIQITRHMGFNLGNAVKYIWRCDAKHDAIEDLRKAAWYIADEIARREREAAKPARVPCTYEERLLDPSLPECVCPVCLDTFAKELPPC